jgi:hypothetical protein
LQTLAILNLDLSLIHKFKADKECPWLRWSVKITGITELTFIQVFLEAVEDILYTCIELQLDVITQNKGII